MTNKIYVVKNSANVSFDQYQPAKLPIGSVIAEQGVDQSQTIEDIGASIGIWESTPGKFSRHVANREFCHIISGWCIFTPEGEEPVELRAGDGVIFPANCAGVWDVKETLRKTYVLF